MTAPGADRWKQVQALFEAALEVPESERRALVASRCGGDAELALEVLGLLAADAENPDYLDGMAAGLADMIRDTSGDDDGANGSVDDVLVGTQLDRYTIESKLARGGMGAVYLARRSDGVYDEQVAIKVIRRGMDSEQVVDRFRVERQILASLRHPNIANLLDGGITADGRPYLVMEYVDGRPIDQYCNEENVDLTTRLTLMRTVCAAVQHAHNNLVVHRDLKPSNILVTGDGTVKLMDFGIAKILASDDAQSPVDAAPETMPGLQVLTPGYAAPEQISGEPITTATDVFGLGIVLYQLLTGARPFGKTGATAQEIAKETCETDPARPSRLVEAPCPVPRRRLAGDLDNICLMALRREPERRYPSPGQLADDLARHQDGDPVAARPATLKYRTTKLMSRYRRAFGALAAVLVVSIALVSFYTARLAHERDRARRGEAKAEHVAAFLTDMFALADPDQSRGADITAREILTRGAERVQTSLADQPEVQGAMLDVLGTVHSRLGLYDEGRDLLNQSLDIKRVLHDGESLDIAATATSLARLESESGHYAEAESLYQSALMVHRDQLGPRSVEAAIDLQGLGFTAAYMGKPLESEAYYREAVAIYESDPAIQGEAYATCLNDFALLLLEQGRGDESEPMFRQALALQQRLLGEDHPEVSNTLFNLALLLRERGDYKAAEPIQRRVLALDRQHYDDTHPNVAYSLMALGSVLTENGQYDEAVRVFREALEIRRRVLAPGHPDLIKNLGVVGLTLHRGGDWVEAEPHLREAVAMSRQHLENHRITAGRLDALGWHLSDRGLYEEALALHHESLEIKLELIGPDHKNTATTYMHIATALKGIGDLEGALAAQEKAVAIGHAAYGAENVYTATTELRLAGILLDLDRADEAFAHAGEAVATMRRVVATDSPRVAGGLMVLGRIHQDRGELVEAERCFREALVIRRDRMGAEHPETAWTKVTLAELLLERGGRREAGELARSGYQTLERKLPAGHVRVATAGDLVAAVDR